MDNLDFFSFAPESRRFMNIGYFFNDDNANID
jgi:hypothetical protein